MSAMPSLNAQQTHLDTELLVLQRFPCPACKTLRACTTLFGKLTLNQVNPCCQTIGLVGLVLNDRAQVLTCFLCMSNSITYSWPNLGQMTGHIVDLCSNQPCKIKCVSYVIMFLRVYTVFVLLRLYCCCTSVRLQSSFLLAKRLRPLISAIKLPSLVPNFHHWRLS